MNFPNTALADMITFPIDISSKKKYYVPYFIESNLRKQCLYDWNSLITFFNEVHRFCSCNFRLINITQLLVPKSPCVWKKLGDETVDPNLLKWIECDIKCRSGSWIYNMPLFYSCMSIRIRKLHRTFVVWTHDISTWPAFISKNTLVRCSCK